MSPPTLCLVVPVHDEGARLATFLQALVASAPDPGATSVQIVVVDDGSGPGAARLQADAVAEAALRLAAAASPHAITLITTPLNQGKGAAIRLGWSVEAGAEWMGFVDGDGAVPALEVWRLATRLAGAPTFDVLSGARLGQLGRRVQRTPLRRLQGRVFARAVEAVLGLGLQDPQCGLKLFRAERLRPLLPRLQEGRWLLDLELLLALSHAGARIVEESIEWRESGRSRLIAGLDPVRMLAGLFRLRARLGAAPAGRAL
jgi:dolichyl-phosphate beta-glucosyltransferase